MKVIVQEMLIQFKEFNTQHRFMFSSLLSHMFLHQNHGFFRNYMGLAMFDENGVRRPISVCTPLLSATYDYYAFSECFLTSILQGFSKDGEGYWLFAKKIGWMQNFIPPYDCFLGENFSFIRICMVLLRNHSGSRYASQIGCWPLKCFRN